MKPSAHRIGKWFIALVAGLVLLAGSYIAWDQSTYNFGTVQPGRVYRSGQMPAGVLLRTLREHGIKTVFNLRGPNPSLTWYPAERKATLTAAATQIDIPMSSCVWMSRAQLRTIVEVLEQADYPMLIHCAWGSERTGLVSAFAELLRPGATLTDARAQFSPFYLFLRVNDGKIMAEHLDRYEEWLRARRLSHSPQSFKRWVDEGFEPGIPTREQWPYDPYPLIVVTRPVGRTTR
jgi:hypothetical protein